MVIIGPTIDPAQSQWHGGNPPGGAWALRGIAYEEQNGTCKQRITTVCRLASTRFHTRGCAPVNRCAVDDTAVHMRRG